MSDPWKNGPRTLVVAAVLFGLGTCCSAIGNDVLGTIWGVAGAVSCIIGARTILRSRVLKAERKRILDEPGDERADRYLG